MARPIPISSHKSPFAALDQFASEADAPRADVSTSEPAIIAISKDKDWQSLFPSEATAEANAPRKEPLFAYAPVPRPVPRAPMRAPGAPDVRPERVQPLAKPSKADRRTWTIAAVVVAPVLVTASFLGTIGLNPPVTPTETAQPVVNPSASVRPVPELRSTTASRQPVGQRSVPTGVPIRGAVNNPQNARGTAAPVKPVARTGGAPVPASFAMRPVETSPVSRPLPSTTGALVLASDVSASALAPPASPSAPPATPATGKVEPVREPEPTPVAAVPPPPPAPSPMPAPVNSDRTAVESILGRYRSAYAALDVNAVRAFWPTVNVQALGSAFDQLQVQKIDFDKCQIDVTGARANAVCGGTARFVPKVGSRNIRVESRRWTFHLVRLGGSWMLERVESR